VQSSLSRASDLKHRGSEKTRAPGCPAAGRDVLAMLNMPGTKSDLARCHSPRRRGRGRSHQRAGSYGDDEVPLDDEVGVGVGDVGVGVGVGVGVVGVGVGVGVVGVGVGVTLGLTL
jgi:hypothetical protein